MAKKRFARVKDGLHRNSWCIPSLRAGIINAHSDALEQRDSDIERLTKSEGRHRRRMEKIERRLEAHSQAIQRGHRSAYDAVTKLTTRIRALEGRRRWDEDDELALHALRILATNPRNQPPAPEPVVVEGPFMLIGRAREMLELAGRVGVCACGGAPFHDDDRVRLTIERVDDEDA